MKTIQKRRNIVLYSIAPFILVAVAAVAAVVFREDIYKAVRSQTGEVLQSSSAGIKAFPGAEGFGSYTPGGRGGTVYIVTNLDDSGPGSLRACAEATGPRICVFEVGGTIVVERELDIESPYLTIAGQTATGDGITLRAAPGFDDATLQIQTHDVVIRGIRIRTGPTTNLSTQRRAIAMEDGSYNIVIDHSSISWAVDENITIIDGVRDVTIQWSIISEALSNSTHAEGEHSKALLISGKNYNNDIRTGNVSVHHNLFAHNVDRNPRHAAWDVVDVVNNVVYNWVIKGVQATDSQTKVPINVDSNYFVEGPNTKYHEVHATAGNGNGVSMYVNGNVGPHRPSLNDPEENIVHPDGRQWIIDMPFNAPPITVTSAEQAYQDVLDNAGVTVPTRDRVDVRVISDVRNRTGSIIDHPSQVGGWPALNSGEPPTDTDRDGMPDAWESERGLDKSSDDSAGDRDGDGYTNIEEYINGLISMPYVEPPPNQDPPEPPAECVLDSAYWVQNEVTEGETAELKVTGTNCEGKLVEFMVLESDVLFNDTATQQPKPAVVTNGVATTTWVAEHMNDCTGGICNPPEFFFLANTDTSEIKSRNNLIVNPPPAPLCSLDQAYWTVEEAVEGETVIIRVIASNCEGKLLTFKVKEDDAFLDDAALQDPPQADVANGIATTYWTAEYPQDCAAGLCNPPEFYFLASFNDLEIRSQNLLVVNPKPTEPPPPPPPSTSLYWEAEECEVVRPFVASDVVFQDITTSVNDGGRLRCPFILETPAQYIVKGMVDAPSQGNNSFYVTMDSDPLLSDQIWDIDLTLGMEERTVTWRGETGSFDYATYDPKVFDLEAGNHTLILGGSERNTKIDKVWLELYEEVLPPVEPPVEPPAACELISASWGTSATLKGESVKLIVSGSNCDGKLVNFEVWKNGLLRDIPAEVYPIPSELVEGIATTLWVAEFDPSCSSTCKYYFIARTDGSEIKSTNELVVSEPQQPPGVSVSFQNSGTKFTESQKVESIPIIVTGNNTVDIKLRLSYLGDATEGEDYSGSQREITIPAGADNYFLSLEFYDDELKEKNEKVIVAMTSVDNAELGSTLDYQVIIQDNDRKNR